MLFTKRPKGMALGLCLLGATFTSGALAEDAYDGKTNGVCAVTHVVACTDDFTCMQGGAHTFDLPTFLFVDIKKDTVRAADHNSVDVTSPILDKEITDNAVILQGRENHRGWTIAIDREDGTFSLSSTGADLTFMVIGNCIAL